MTARLLPDAPWRHAKPAMRVLDLLNAGGEEARVVGGAVRNALLGLPVGELDIATTALPAEVMRRAKAVHIKTMPTGIAHGTVTLVTDGTAFEVTTLREDVETFGRKARVAFGRDWSRDAQRRDFTINGLSWSRDGVIHDHVGGLDDIAQRRVQFIGDPDQRIAEDYLRILRFFRIHAAYGIGAPDDAAMAACVRGRAGLAVISAERVRMELLKLLVAQGAAAALNAMAEHGLLVPMIGVPYRGPFAAMIDAERELGSGADELSRLGALCVVTVEDAARISQRLRLSNAEAKRLHTMADRWWILDRIDETGARAILYACGAQAFRDRARLAWARLGGDAAEWRKRVTLPERWTAPKFPLKAVDFIPRGIAEGPALGHVLDLAETRWIADGFPSDQIALDGLADASVADFQRSHRL